MVSIFPFSWSNNCCFSLQHLLRVIPVIGILRDKKAFNPTPNPAEVESVFDAPLEMFIKVCFFFFSENGGIQDKLHKRLEFSTYFILFV